MRLGSGCDVRQDTQAQLVKRFADEAAGQEAALETQSSGSGDGGPHCWTEKEAPEVILRRFPFVVACRVIGLHVQGVSEGQRGLRDRHGSGSV